MLLKYVLQLIYTIEIEKITHVFHILKSILVRMLMSDLIFNL